MTIAIVACVVSNLAQRYGVFMRYKNIRFILSEKRMQLHARGVDGFLFSRKGCDKMTLVTCHEMRGDVFAYIYINNYIWY